MIYGQEVYNDGVSGSQITHAFMPDLQLMTFSRKYLTDTPKLLFKTLNKLVMVVQANPSFMGG